METEYVGIIFLCHVGRHTNPIGLLANMKVITSIYLNCRPDLRDEWLVRDEWLPRNELEDANEALVCSDLD